MVVAEGPAPPPLRKHRAMPSKEDPTLLMLEIARHPSGCRTGGREGMVAEGGEGWRRAAGARIRQQRRCQRLGRPGRRHGYPAPVQPPTPLGGGSAGCRRSALHRLVYHGPTHRQDRDHRMSSFPSIHRRRSRTPQFPGSGCSGQGILLCSSQAQLCSHRWSI